MWWIMSRENFTSNEQRLYIIFCYNILYNFQKDIFMLALKQEQLFEEIDILPIDLKTKIVDKILASITPSNSTIDSLWIKEVNKRKNEIENNQVSLREGDEVFKKISQRLNA